MNRSIPADARRVSAAAPLVSVALAAHNGAAFLRAQIDSVLAQTHAALELVAVDDASDDATPDILRDYAARDPRVRVERNAGNLGFNANFAKALSLCRGDFIAPCDQDDLWFPDKLSRLLEAVGEADIAYCDSEYIDDAGAPLGRRLSSARGMYAGNDPLALVLTNSVSGHAALCRRELAERCRPFPEGIYYDWWLAINAAAGRGIRYVDRPLVQCRRHGSTVSTLGGTQGAWTSVPVRAHLIETRRRVGAMRRLSGTRQHEIAVLDQALQAWLEEGRRLPLLRFIGRHAAVMLHVLRPRLPSLGFRLLRTLSPLGRGG